MTLGASVRAAIMAAILASAGFGQDRVKPGDEPLGLSPRDSAAQQQMYKTGDPRALEKTIPGFRKEVPNRTLSGDTPATNSTLQETRDGNLGFQIGWLGLLGLAGLFGLGRGSSNMPRAPGNEMHTHSRH